MSRDNLTSPARAAEGPEMIERMRQGVVEALLEHKRLGQSVVVWDYESNRPVHLRAEEIVVPEADMEVDGSQQGRAS